MTIAAEQTMVPRMKSTLPCGVRGRLVRSSVETRVAQGTPLVHQALQDFKKKLAGFQAVARNNFILVDTQGTLNNPDYAQDWANECILTRRGSAQWPESS